MRNEHSNHREGSEMCEDSGVLRNGLNDLIEACWWRHRVAVVECGVGDGGQKLSWDTHMNLRSFGAYNCLAVDLLKVIRIEMICRGGGIGCL